METFQNTSSGPVLRADFDDLEEAIEEGLTIDFFGLCSDGAKHTVVTASIIKNAALEERCSCCYYSPRIWHSAC